MANTIFNENSKGMRILQHILFVVLAFFVLLNVFKFSSPPSAVDYVYTSLFFATIMPVIYFHLYWLLPKLRSKPALVYYLLPLLLIMVLFIWINLQLFNHWSVKLFPGFYFISYYEWWEITIRNGSTVSGIIASETATAIALRDPSGSTKMINRSQISSLQASSHSVMPAGLELNMTVA